MGAIDTLPPDSQLEAIYVGYFGRAADGGGFAFWTGQYTKATTQLGESADAALQNIANSFTPQPETIALYPFLASTGGLVGSYTSPVVTAELVTFVQQVYQNLFDRTPAATDGGVTYWVARIQGADPANPTQPDPNPADTPIPVAQAILDIANGATGADLTTMDAKITAATFFTSQTAAAGLGVSTVSPAFLTAARAANTDVTTSGDTTKSEADTTAFITGAGVAANTFLLTQNIDAGAAFTTSATGAIFNALPFVTSVGIGNNTLNTGDTLTDTAGDGTLNFTATGGAAGGVTIAANPPMVTGVTLTGIKTLAVTNLSTGTAGITASSVTGLTVVNESNSTQGVTLGSVAAGLKTALTNVNVTGYGGPNGSALFSGVIAGSVSSTANTIAVAITGAVGNTQAFMQNKAGADILSFSTDSGSAGTKAAPNAAYGTWSISSTGTSNLELTAASPGVTAGGAAPGSTLGQPNVVGATALVLSGAGNVAVGESTVGDWQLLKSIDASGATGSVYITGAASGIGSNADQTALNPGALFGSQDGLLDGNTALTSFKLGTGVNTLDVSSFTTDAQLGALTTVAGTNALTTNKIIVASALADTTLATDFANIAGFQILGDVGAGGTINLKNLPSSINDIFYQTGAVAGLTINNQTAALTVDTEANGNGLSLTVGAVGPASSGTLSVIEGSVTQSAGGAVGVITATGDTTFNLIANGGPASGGDATGEILLQPTVAPLVANATVTISGNTVETIGSSGFGAIADLVSIAGMPGHANLQGNVLTITDTDSAVVTLETTQAFNNLGFATGGAGATPLSYAENAVTIDAHTSGGLILLGGDANFTTFTNTTISNGSTGDTITGSATAGNVLIGSIGNDGITGTLSLTTPDTIVTEGGADTIKLALGHTAADHIELYAGFTPLGGVVAPGGVVGALTASIVSATDVAQVGWFGEGTGNVIGAVPGGLTGGVQGTGTSLDQSTVTNFVTGSATAPQDVVDLSIKAFSSFLIDGSGVAVAGTAGGVASTIGQVAAGGTVVGAPTVVFDTANYSNAANLASALKTAATTITLSAAPAGAGDHHLIVIYSDLLNTHIADVEFTGANAKLSLDTHVVVSDLVQLTGISAAAVTGGNIHFVS